jgi:polysaccharide pyruvyl transferase WcaK-like protein
MKIGLLAYHSAINFGANLQLLSTFRYLTNAGHNPVVINWVPEDLEVFYKNKSLPEQIKACNSFRHKVWRETRLCRNSKDIAEVINEEKIQAVIIGSDAVAQHHPFLERLVFPTRTVIKVKKFTSDRLFPNAFWGDFNLYLTHSVPVAVLSASSQDSAYKMFPIKVRRQMKRTISEYKYISVRDDWTQKMIYSITSKKIKPKITPDPVFAFNQNAGTLLPSRKELMSQYDLPTNYILLSFRDYRTVSQNWINEFERLAAVENLYCVSFPFSDRVSKGVFKKEIKLPLSPLDWYSLIKYSSGYVGHNMHPIVVALHNGVPFFSFDNYGTVKMNGYCVNDKSSKIRHILEMAEMNENRVSCLKRGFKAPSPKIVFDALKNCDKSKEIIFAKKYHSKYQRMMEEIIESISR